jgi:hypothetical protein
MNRLQPLLFLLVMMIATACATEPPPPVVIPTLAQLPTTNPEAPPADTTALDITAAPTEPMPTPVPTSTLGIRIDGLFQGSLQAANGETVAQVLATFTQIGDELTGNFLLTDTAGAMAEVAAQGTVATGSFDMRMSGLLVGEWALFADSTCETVFNITYTVEDGRERINSTVGYAPACADFAPASTARGSLSMELTKAVGS